jgi:chemotaxis signal transduction protein
MNESAVRLVCFELCGEAFAFNMEHLIEIVQIRASEITPCFTPVPFVRGTWMYRETPVYVIDLREFFDLTLSPSTQMPPSENHVSPHADEEPATPQSAEEGDHRNAAREKRDKSMLVIRVRESVLGIFTDAVIQVVSLSVFYEYPDLISTLPRRYIAGIIRVRNTLALVLAIEELLGEYEIQALLDFRENVAEPDEEAETSHA